MAVDRVRTVQAFVAQVTPKTRWIFVRLITEAGLYGHGEATLSGREDAVITAIAELATVLRECRSSLPGCLPLERKLASLPEAAAYSSLDQALWDLESQHHALPLADVLGVPERRTIPLYANINRRTVDRSPEGFAVSAQEALDAGYEAIKIAPLDEVDPSSSPAALGAALQRIEAVRSAVGPARRLMVDCHWRLNEGTAAAFIDAAAQFQLYWIECPLAETLDRLPALRRLRGLANQHGIRLAGCEENVRRAGFAPFLDAGAYDAMMPDAKYAGGLREMLELSDAFARRGVEFSPHNPTGPVCHAASLHVCAVAKNLSVLEVQFDETPWFHRLQSPALAPVGHGMASVPTRSGLGISLDTTALQQCATLAWSSIDSR